MVTDRWRSERVRHLVAARSLADRAGATLESVTVEQAAPLGATDVTERVEEAVRQTAERRDVDARDLSQALSILLRAIERAVQRLDDNPDVILPPDELYALEAVIRVDGTRPSLLIRNGAVDPAQPSSGAWAEQLAAAGNQLSRAIAAIGRVEPAQPTGSDYFGTCWVVDHHNGLVLTNRHVLQALRKRLPHAVAGTATGFRVSDGAFVDFAAESGNAEIRRYRVVEAIPSRLDELDAAVLRIEPLPGGPADIPHAVPVSTDPDGPLGRLSSYCIVGYPGPPKFTSGTAEGVNWTWVTQTLFGRVYGVKRLAPGTTHRPLGTVAAGKRRGVFGHDATTLGGNSGSPLLTWTGEAFGLHFAGRSVDTNYAHAVSATATELQTLGVPLAASATTPARRRPRPGRVERPEDVGSSNHNWRVEFTAAADTFQWDDLHVLSTRYVQEINGHTSLESEKAREVRDVLDILRTNLRYEDLELVADAALAHNPSGAAVRRLYAQALVDGHNPALALLIYDGVVRDRTATPEDRLDARGGVGRCYKDLFLTCTDQHRRHRYLVSSIDSYLRAFKQHRRYYHGINAVAMLARAVREGIEPDDTRLRPLAHNVLALVNDALADDGWGQLTACEALIALGRNDEALTRAEAYLNTNPSAFNLAAFLRQLTDIWQIDATSLLGDQLLPLLRSALLTHTGGQVLVEPQDISARRLHRLDQDTQLQSILGTTRYRDLRWYKKASPGAAQ